MGEYTVSLESGGGVSVNFGATGVQEILQNVAMIISSVTYSCPMDREFALDATMLDRPLPVAQTILRSRIVAAVKKYEPRATITKVTFSGSASDGVLRPKVMVRIHDG